MTSARPDRVLARIKAANKKALLTELSKAAAEVTGLHERQILDVLIERERLGSTGLGGGIAIPHGKYVGLDRVYEIFAQLDKPVDFEAVDHQPVDLIYVLLAPNDAGADHLQALSRASRMLRNQSTVAKLRGSDTVEALTLVISSHQEEGQKN